MNHRTEILPGVYLTAVQSDKFKTGCFSLNLLRPMKKEEAAANALIPSVLLRGSEVPGSAGDRGAVGRAVRREHRNADPQKGRGAADRLLLRLCAG